MSEPADRPERSVGGPGPAVVRAIAALDDRLGIATDTGIPWSVPADVEHFRRTTADVDVLMGYGTYVEYAAPMPGRRNFVATSSTTLRDGFLAVPDAVDFLARRRDDVWVIGGGGLFAATLPQTDELHLTRIGGDYGCTKFFPPFESAFQLVEEEATPAAGDVPAYRFETWRRPQSAGR